jgi:hypothetical protein
VSVLTGALITDHTKPTPTDLFTRTQPRGNFTQLLDLPWAWTPQNSVVQFIPPRAAEPGHDVADSNFALHDNGWDNAKRTQSSALDEPC